MIGKFLRGAASIGQVGHSGGTDQNSITVAEDGRKGSDYHWGNTPWSSGHNPATGGQTFTIDNRPAFTEILFLMKL
ncbi:hypothetical protein DW352_06180 [Pseudolabrys taiwanensis]|uniref:Uncharacterized protein n=1 Tax=Pseudolabrys taiwanensis TaxID=331696 RepID=A0A345ZT93_9HYPH|nr:hypothetical protein DW352_06180 [Pseudolabrys taiwanensis]